MTTIETKIAKNGSTRYYVRDNETGKLRRISAVEAQGAVVETAPANVEDADIEDADEYTEEELINGIESDKETLATHKDPVVVATANYNIALANLDLAKKEQRKADHAWDKLPYDVDEATNAAAVARCNAADKAVAEAEANVKAAEQELNNAYAEATKIRDAQYEAARKAEREALGAELSDITWEGAMTTAAAVDAAAEAEIEIAQAEADRDAAKAAYDKACATFNTAFDARQDFLDKTAGDLTQKLHEACAGNNFIETATLSGSHYTIGDITNIYIDPTVNGKFVFVTYNNRELARYDTPAQVETVITRLKDAVEKHEPEFAFPTVEELTPAPEPADNAKIGDSLTRAMKTALEKFQGFCWAKNLTAAENELKLYNICRKAMTELWKEQAA